MVGLRDGQSMQDCPSWVPVWTEPRKAIELHWTLFNAHLSRKADIGYQDENNTLQFSGYAFERVQALSPGLKAAAQTTANMNSGSTWQHSLHSEEIEFLSSAWNLAESFQTTTPGDTGLLQRPYHSPDDVLGAFVCTLCGNWRGDDGRVDASSKVINTAKF
ncbi:hypothetical protein CDV36_016166 [Fusarium kuroshium]|uniref:Uncharacterized protein n=2 Tax=Fusarium solani species complex TaxID=232080 RepID=A0A3M2QYE7_9HYPO|nr:hypothetical protein CDV36_016166 [Fusarium kuroshium]